MVVGTVQKWVSQILAVGILVMCTTCWAFAQLTEKAKLGPNAKVTMRTPYAQMSPSQKRALELAREYLKREDWAMAIDTYAPLMKEEALSGALHNEYFHALVNGKGDVERYIKKAVRRHPAEPFVMVDGIQFYQAVKKEDKAQDVFDEFLKKSAASPQLIEAAAKYASTVGRSDLAEQLYLAGRKASIDPMAFALPLSTLYKSQGKLDKMYGELLNLAERDPNMLFQIQTTLQSNITKREEYDGLAQALLDKTQRNPENMVYTELLYWLYIQLRDFEGAFIQAKSIDRRYNMQGGKLWELGNLCQNNKAWSSGILVFRYIAENMQGRPIALEARKALVNCQEEKMKQRTPVDVAELRQVIKSYKTLIRELNNKYQTLNAERSLANLYAFYANRADSAVAILEPLVKVPQMDEALRNRSKIDLADIYMLQGVFWEATLLYSQVELDQKEAPLGHEAKLKNAKLNYYKGEFQLAEEHLDILKQATSREISNDALDLALRIQDGLAEDSLGAALAAFSRVELLMYQHQEIKALAQLDSLMKQYKGSSLDDDALLVKGKLLLQMSRHQEALAQWAELSTRFPTSMYADDALLLTGEVQENNLGNEKAAMAAYEQLIEKFPGSFLTAEARKRFRKLRGDKLEPAG